MRARQFDKYCRRTLWNTNVIHKTCFKIVPNCFSMNASSSSVVELFRECSCLTVDQLLTNYVQLVITRLKVKKKDDVRNFSSPSPLSEHHFLVVNQAGAGRSQSLSLLRANARSIVQLVQKFRSCSSWVYKSKQADKHFCACLFTYGSPDHRS